jgi:putative tryptophan/tyrosine transport system substrate-binding protein
MEGGNSEIDIRWAASDVELMKRFARELVTLQPDLILTRSTPATAAMLQQTRTIPIIFVLVADPVGSGFLASLPRPSGNATGFTPIVGSLGGKWVELLKKIAPRVARVTDMPGVESLVSTEAREPSSGLVVIPDAFTVGHRSEITALAARYHVPAVYWSRSFAEVGGLISYGPYIVDEYRRAASYADRILHGSKPSELPVQAQSSLSW